MMGDNLFSFRHFESNKRRRVLCRGREEPFRIMVAKRVTVLVDLSRLLVYTIALNRPVKLL
jgi:hypothetical protein